MPHDEKVDPAMAEVITGWNMMRGTIEWSALGFIADKIGVENFELWVDGLLEMQRQQSERTK